MRRLVFLPSNGLAYSGVAEVREPTNRDLAELHAASFATQFDMYLNVVANFATVAGCRPERLLLCDLYFMFMYVQFFAMPHEDGVEPSFSSAGLCPACGGVSRVRLTPDGMEYTYRNRFDAPEATREFESGDVAMTLRPRVAEDNLAFAAADADAMADPIALMKAYVETSASSVRVRGEDVPVGEWGQALDNLSEDGLVGAYSAAVDVSRAHCGLSTRISYACQCGEKAVSPLFNDVIVTSRSASVPGGGDAGAMVKGLVNTARYRIASYEELMSQPASETRTLMKALQATNFVSTMGGLA